MATEVGSIKSTLGADVGGFLSGMKAAKGGLAGFAMAAGKAAAASGAVAAAVTAASVKIAGDFESSLVSAGAKAGATDKQLQQMKTSALEASAASEFGAGQAAQALGFLAQAGFTVEQQMKALPGVLSLASAGELELAQAADIASNVLTGFGKSAQDLAEVNDVLVKTANSANTSVSQLGQAMSFAAPAATGAGVSIQEAAAIIGKLSDAGIQAGRAGRSFNAILGRLGKVAGELGGQLSGAEIASLGFSGSLDRLQEMGLSAQNAVELFGQRAGPAIQALLTQGTGSINELTTALQNAGGTAGDVAAKKINTLNGALNVMTGNVQNVAIRYGDAFLPVLREIVPLFSEMADELVKNDKLFRRITDAVVDFVPVAAKASFVLGDNVASVHQLASSTGALLDAMDVLSEGFRALALAAAGDFEGAQDALDEMHEDIINLPDRLQEAAREADEIRVATRGFAKDLQEAGEAARFNVDQFRKMQDAATATAKDVSRINQNFGAFPEVEGSGVVRSSPAPTPTPRRDEDKPSPAEKRTGLEILQELTGQEAQKLDARRANEAAFAQREQTRRENQETARRAFGRTTDTEAEQARDRQIKREMRLAAQRKDMIEATKGANKVLQTSVGAFDELGSSILSVAGAGETASRVLSTTTGALSAAGSAVSQFASGNILGGIAATVGGLAGVIGGMGGGGQRAGGGRDRITTKEIGDIMGQRIAEHLEDADLRPQVIEFNARGKTAGEMFDDMEREARSRGRGSIFRRGTPS